MILSSARDWLVADGHVVAPVVGVRVGDVIEVVEVSHGLGGGDLLRHDRAHASAHPRQMAMWMARRLTGKSYPEIGLIFGRHHTTVMHGVAAHGRRMDRDGDVAALTRRLVREVCG